MNEDDARTKLAELLEQSGESSDGEESVFDSPAQARAFGLVVALSREGAFEWNEFRDELVERIATDDGSLETDTERSYYDHWLEAIESLLEKDGYVLPDELDERAREFASGDRDASEFVVGERGH